MIQSEVPTIGPGYTPTNISSGAVCFSTGTQLTGNSAALFWDNTNFRLGIGTNSPISPIQVGNGSGGAVTTDHQILVYRNAGNAFAGSNGRAFCDLSVIDRSGGIGYESFDACMTVTGSQNYDHISGFQSRPQIGTSGTVTNSFHFISLEIVNAGTVTNSYGLYISDITGAGTVTNQYGVYIPQLLKGGANYAIYTAGATQSVFNGSVGFGSATPRRTIDSLSTSAAQARLTYTDNSVYTDLQTNSSGQFLITPTGTMVASGATTNTVDLGGSSNLWKNIYFGTQALGPAGTVSNPTYSFSARTNYGFYLNNASPFQIIVSMAGAAIAAFDNTNTCLRLPNTWALGWSGSGAATAVSDLQIIRVTTGVLGVQNATTAQEVRVYGTTTGPVYVSLRSDGTNAYLTQSGGNQIAFASAQKGTGDTTGYLTIPTCAGTPTGVPANIPAGQLPIVYDATNNFLYVYNGGWKKSTVYA